MRELIKFETTKLLHKPLVWVMLAGTLFFMAIMEYNWAVPGYSAVQEEVNEQSVFLTGFDAIQRNQEIAALYHGSLTDEKVQSVIAAYELPDSFWEARSADPSLERHYTHNLLYDTLAQYGFVNMDGSYSGVTVEEVFGGLAPEMVLGYSTGWECTIYLLLYTLLTWGCVVVIIVSPTFSEEYTRHMDALILTGNHGRKQCARAKIIAAFFVSAAGTLVIIAAATFLMLAVHGTAGWDASTQLGELGIFSGTPYPLNWLQAYSLGCLAWLGAILVLTAMTLVISVLAKSSFSSLVIAFTLYVVPLFVPWYLLSKLELIGYLLPIKQLQLMDLYQQNLLSIGGLSFPPALLALPVTLAALLIGVPWARRSFAKHQVVF